MADIKFDIVIVSHEIDFYKIKFIIEKIDEFLPDSEEIHLILSDRNEYIESNIIEKMTKKLIFYHKESDVLKIDKNKIRHRPNWIYQMMLKFFQNVTKNDNYLIIESDAVILSKLNFFENDKTIFYLGLDQNHTQYFNFTNKILGIGREFNYSFISEFMMYNKKIINSILDKSNCRTIGDFLELIYNNVDSNCYPADYELYGNFCYKYYKDKYEIKHIKSKSSGRHHHWNEREIKEFIDVSKDYDVISFHTYK